MINALVAVAMIICAIQAIRVKKLLTSALWLAGCSAMVALMLYLLGAPEIAVIELSVGAGLVTVLFVFAINIIGDEKPVLEPGIPPLVAWALIILSIGILAYLNLPLLSVVIPDLAEIPMVSTTIWNDRMLDVILQVLLIFVGVLGVIGLISDSKAKEINQ
jgi:NADH:ubiquinone oxidoreductase subunit 6 (subunit J)